MRDFVKVSPSIWRSRKFRSLPDIYAKHAYLYLLICPHGNAAGCFDFVPGYAAADLEWSEDVFRKALDSLEKAYLVEVDWEENTILIVNWETFNQPTNAKHAQGILSELNKVSSDRLKAKAFHRFVGPLRARKFDQEKGLRDAISSLLKAYPEPIVRERETEKEIQKETETRGETDLDFARARETAQPPFASQAGNGASPSGVNPELVKLVERLDKRTPDEFPELPHHLKRRVS